MPDYSIINIREIIYSTGDMQKATDFFEGYGGWNRVGKYKTDGTVLADWNLDADLDADEVLIQSNHYEHGQLRIIKFNSIQQEYIRSSQQPWDTGGIMDINLRVHEVAENFDRLREMGWHGLSDPMLQVMGPFKLYDILMRGFDDVIIAFTHRLEPPMELTAPINFPTHVYKTSLTVKSLEESKSFFVDKLGCQVLTEYAVIKDKPQENMFGLPFNLADKVTCKAVILSIHGGKDTDFQIVEFNGVTGKDFSATAIPPNRGFLLYRVEVNGLMAYQDFIIKNQVDIHRQMSTKQIEPYGQVDSFSVLSPDGAWFEFFETLN